jgi:hypothetical protein
MTNSYERINCLLRPKKQIERKIIAETLQHLDNLIDISKYHYFGFGSIYYADFQLFHKYLNIERMTSIDKSADDESRFKFNKSYGFIEFEISDVKDYLPTRLNWDDNLFIWLDFDNEIDEDIVSSIKFIASKAKPLDIFIITVNAHSPDIKVAGLFENFMVKFGQYLEPTLTKTEFKKNYTKILQKIIKACVYDGITHNQEKRKFLQLFNFCYEDGSNMYTYGGIFYDLDANPSLETLKDRISTLTHVYGDDDIGNIDCPIITAREKLYIDSYIKEGEFRGELNNFCLCEADLKKYSKYYKYYPQFFESIY